MGQHSLYQPPVSMISTLPSASSITSVGWKSRSGDDRNSSSRVVNVLPFRVNTCRDTLCLLNWQASRLSSKWSSPSAVECSRLSPQGAAAPR